MDPDDEDNDEVPKDIKNHETPVVTDESTSDENKEDQKTTTQS